MFQPKPAIATKVVNKGNSSGFLCHKKYEMDTCDVDVCVHVNENFPRHLQKHT